MENLSTFVRTLGNQFIRGRKIFTGIVGLEGTVLDGNTSAGTNGQVLSTTGSGVEWITVGSSDVAELNDLTDVIISSPSTGQLLRFNGENWVNWTHNFLTTSATLSSLADVGNLNPTDGQILVYNSASGLWIADDMAEFLETDTLDTVTDRGATTTNNISVGNVTSTKLISPTWEYNGKLTIQSTHQTSQGDPTYTFLAFNFGTTDVVTVDEFGYITGTGFKTPTGTSAGFLKADGSVDTTTYLTSGTETQTLDDVTDLGNTTTNTITVGGVTTDYVQLKTSVTPPEDENAGYIGWDSDWGAPSLFIADNQNIYLGQDSHWYVKNGNASTLAAGTVVMASGSVGASSKIEVDKMVADGTVSSKYIVGVVKYGITTGNFGYAVTQGTIKGINTSSWSEGDVLWCDPSTDGGLTNVEPSAPNLRLPIAFVVNAATNGAIAVRITQGNILHELHDVDAESPSNNDILRYNGTSGIWENWTPTYIEGESDTLDSVTDRGATTTNAITVGGLTATSSSNDSDVLRIGNTEGNSGSIQGITHVGINHFGGGTYTSTRITAYQDGASGWAGGMYFSTRSLNTDSAPVERMRITSSGNVGIGTTSPAYKLDVDGPIRAQEGTVYFSTGAYNYISYSSTNGYYRANGVHYFEGNGFFKGAWDSSGNLGIGTTSPEAKLDIRAGSGFIRLGSYDDNYHVKIEGGDQLNFRNGVNAATAYIQYAGPGHTLLSRNLFVEGNSSGGVNGSVRITSAGNVGIGTTSPAAKLDVNGGGNFSGGTVTSGIDSAYTGVAIPRGAYLKSNDGNYLRNIIGHNSSGNIEIGQAGTGLIGDIQLKPGTSGNITFYSSGSEDMRINSSGNVGIGTTSPDSKLHVSGTLKATGAVTLSNYGAGFLKTDANGLVSVDTSTYLTSYTETDTLDSVTDRGATTTNSITLGESSTGGSVLAYGTYSNGNIIVIGGVKSSGGPMIGYGLKPDTVTSHGFVSSSGAALTRGAYYINGNEHRWYSGGSQTVAIGGAVSISQSMTLNSSGYLGIGTTSPSEKLHVAGNGLFTGGIYVNNTSAYLWNTTNGVIRFGTNNLERARIDSSGNVGIGTASPSNKLDVVGSILAQSSGYVHIRVDQTDSGMIDMGMTSGTAEGFLNVQNTGAGHVATAPEFKVLLNASEKMRIDSSGNVGIGTTSPSEALHIYRNASSTEIRLQNNTISSYIRSGTDNLNFYVSNSEKVRITSGGNVGIGTTSPAYKLDIVGDTYTSGKYVSNTGEIISLYQSNWNAGNQNHYVLYNGWRSSTGDYLMIKSSGNQNTGEAAMVLADGSSGGRTYFGTHAAQAQANDNALTPLDSTYAFIGASGTYFSSNVGIGTTSPISKLHSVIGGNGSALMLNNSLGGVNAYVDLEFNTYDVAVANYANSAAAIRVIDDGAYSGHITFRTKGSSIGASQVERMRIQASTGNVGIGTTSPNQKLHVNGNAQIDYSLIARGFRSANRGELFLNATGSNDVSEIFFGYGSGYTENNIRWCISDRGTTTGQLNFYRGPAFGSFAVALTLYKNLNASFYGNVGIGTTSPSYTFTVSKSVSSDWLAQIANTATGSANGLLIDAGDGTNGEILRLRTAAGSSKVSFMSNGNVGIGTTNPTAKLEVVGDTYIRTQLFTDTIRPYSGNQLRLLNGGLNTLFVDGNAGFGTTSPSYTIDVSGGAIAIRGNAPGNSLRFDDTTATSRNALYVDTSNYLNIGNSNYAGVKFVQTTSFSNTVATKVVGELVTNGTIDDIALGIPDAWLAVRIGTTDYAIPMYST